MLYKEIKNNKGFAMLFAVLISSMLITIGVSIFNISIKELVISASVRDSQAAYYAADSATECFLYWNGIVGSFEHCSDGSCPSDVQIQCNSNNIPFTVSRDSLDTFTTISGQNFRYSTTSSDIEPEASIKIEKRSTGDGIETTGYFYGYNTGVSGRRVERSYKRII